MLTKKALDQLENAENAKTVTISGLDYTWHTQAQFDQFLASQGSDGWYQRDDGAGWYLFLEDSPGLKSRRCFWLDELENDEVYILGNPRYEDDSDEDDSDEGDEGDAEDHVQAANMHLTSADLIVIITLQIPQLKLNAFLLPK
jgi:hypothetical protein